MDKKLKSSMKTKTFTILCLGLLVVILVIWGFGSSSKESWPTALQPIAENLGLGPEETSPAPVPFETIPPQLQPVPTGQPGNTNMENPFAPRSSPPTSNPNPLAPSQSPGELNTESPSFGDCWVTVKLVERNESVVMVVETNANSPANYLWGQTSGLDVEKRFGMETTGRQSVYTNFVSGEVDQDVVVSLYSDPSLTSSKLLCRSI
jgi:hypothetical protein